MKLSSFLLVAFFVVASCNKPTSCLSQNQKTNFKIIVTGDSHTLNTPPNGWDSIWVNKIKNLFEQYYDTVTLVNMATQGGRTIGSVMPGWFTHAGTFSNSEPIYSIDTVLKQNPDLIIISYSGNHTVNSWSADDVIYCYKYLTDTLNSLGKTFIFTGQAPRQKTFIFPITTQTYHDSSLKIDAFIESYHPKGFVNTHEAMHDTGYEHKPKAEYIGPDSLHLSSLGNLVYYQCHIDNFIIDSCLTDFKCSATQFNIKKSSSNIVLDGNYRYRKIIVSGSNDYQNFTEVKKIYSNNTNLTNVSSTFVDVGYLWYKIEVFSGKLLSTITKKLN